jgi:hypothetical protein
MKRIIYFISIVLVSALYSCSGQYDNIEQYATDETIYVGKYDDMPEVKIGHNRVEIDLMPYLGRVASDDIYLGKAKKTVVEYDESDGPRRIVFDSVCSWVNITGLTFPRTYIFRIYTEDEYGNKSIAIEALGRPFTDDDLAGFSFPLPYVIPTPSTMEFKWTAESGISSSLFQFAELIHWYVDRSNDTIEGKLTSTQTPRFSITNLLPSDNIPIHVICKLIPLMESGPILDTVTMEREFYAKTVSVAEYLNSRTMRPIASALINPDNLSEATITWGGESDHLVWTEICYAQSDGTYDTIHVSNSSSATLCTDIKRGEKIRIRCAYTPPETKETLVTEWTNYASSFMVKYEPKNWVVVPRNGNHGWGNDGVGSQNIWSGGHPMLILDDDLRSGWHSKLGTPLPQVLIIDMKETKPVSKVILSNNGGGGYWYNIELYLTDNLSMPGYVTHTIDWASDTRVSDYTDWVNKMMAIIPANPPASSWGSPIYRAQAKREASLSFLLPQTLQGRFLIVLFPDNNSGWSTYIDVGGVEVYSE